MDDEELNQILDKGVDLRAYSRDVEKELELLERGSVDDYLKEASNMAKLHQEVKTCDGILHNMESMLSVFQRDLSQIAGEIQTLQNQSVLMNQKLENRQSIQADLRTYVEHLGISGQLVDEICGDGDLSPQFEANLKELHEKLEFVSACRQNATLAPQQLQPQKSGNAPAETESTSTSKAGAGSLPMFQTVKALADVEPELMKLKANATERIKEAFITKIHSARKPMSNLQNIQQYLLRHSHSFDFLTQHSQQSAVSVQRELTETFSKVHFSYYKAYIARLMKLKYEQEADKDDVLAAPDTAPKRSGFFSTKVVMKNRSTTFALGDRASILKELDEPVLVPHAQDIKLLADKTKFTFERLFRSYMKSLVNTAVSEYLFALEFFGVSDDLGRELYAQVMGKTLHLVLKHVETHVAASYDVISVMLCLCILDSYKAQVEERGLHFMSSFFASLHKLFHDSLLRILEHNADSVRRVDPEHMHKLDTRPHYIVRRYAEMSGALLALNEVKPVVDTDTVMAPLSREVEGLILRLAAEFPERKEQLIFLINNYDLMASVYSERTSGGSTEAQATQEMLRGRVRDFAFIALQKRFGGLLSFVKQAESASAKNAPITVDEAAVSRLISSFNENWKIGIDEIDQEAMLSFPNFKNGRRIVEESLTQMVLAYEKFISILKKPPFKRKGGWNGLTDIHQILVEVKKHKTSF